MNVPSLLMSPAPLAGPDACPEPSRRRGCRVRWHGWRCLAERDGWPARTLFARCCAPTRR